MSDPIKKSDLQLVLDAVAGLKKDFEIATAVPIPPAPLAAVSAPEPLTIERVRELIAESIKIPEAKPADPVVQVKEVPVEVIKTVYVFEKPEESKFPTKEEFNKTLADYEAFKKAVLEEAKKELGPVLTKKAPDTKDSTVIDIDAVFNKIANAEMSNTDDIESLLNEVK